MERAASRQGFGRGRGEREREREVCRTLGNPFRMIRRCFFPIVVTLPPFSSRLLTSVAHCDAREATFETQPLSVSIQ